MATVPLELYKLFEKKLGKEEAEEAIKLVEEALRAIEENAKAQKVILKAELKDELRKELITKEEFYGETGKIRQEMETIRQEIKNLDTKIEFVRREMRILFILFYVMLAFMILLNKGTIEFVFKVLELIK